MSKINVCSYARVSTDSKDQENSYENQKSYFKREIEKNENYKLVEVYADRGLTATSTTRRKEFLRMVHDAGIDVDMYAYTHESREKHEQIFTLSDREPLFSKIFVKNTSRFSRNIDVIDLLRKLRNKGVYVEFLDIDKTTENEADFVFIEMLLVFDENDSRDKSRKVRFGQLEGMKKGVIHTNSQLFAYKQISKYKLEIIPDESEIVKFIYENYANGDGVRVIGNMLKEKGYKTRKGKNFGKSSIMGILKNPKYRGDNVRNRYTTGTIFVDKTITSQERDKEDWIVHEDTIPAIVTDELWQKCEDIRLSRTQNKRGVYSGRTKYAGLIQCDVCGEVYHRNVDKGRYFYNCSTKRKLGVKGCNSINISEIDIIDSLEGLADGGFYADIIYDKDSYVLQMKMVMQIITKKLNEGINKKEVEQLQNKLEEVEKQKNRLSDLFLSGRIKIDYFDNKSESLDQQDRELSEQLRFFYTDKETILEEINDIQSIIEKLKNLDIKEIYTEEEILKEIDKIVICRSHEDEKEVELTFHYNIITEMNKLTEKYGEEFYNNNRSHYKDL